MRSRFAWSVNTPILTAIGVTYIYRQSHCTTNAAETVAGWLQYSSKYLAYTDTEQYIIFIMTSLAWPHVRLYYELRHAVGRPVRAQELCEKVEVDVPAGLPSLISLRFHSVDVKRQHFNQPTWSCQHGWSSCGGMTCAASGRLLSRGSKPDTPETAAIQVLSNPSAARAVSAAGRVARLIDFQFFGVSSWNIGLGHRTKLQALSFLWRKVPESDARSVARAVSAVGVARLIGF